MTLSEAEALQARRIIEGAKKDYEAAPYAWSEAELIIMALDRKGFICKPNQKDERSR